MIIAVVVVIDVVVITFIIIIIIIIIINFNLAQKTVQREKALWLINRNTKKTKSTNK